MYTNRFDSHTHSLHSHDGFHSVDDLCQSAVKQGLVGICITDHCECNFYEELGCGLRIKKSLASIAKARVDYEGRLIVSRGIELGQHLQNEAAAKEALAFGGYDFVLGSLHNSAGQEDFYYMDYSSPKVVVRDIMTQYYTEMRQVAASDAFDVLAHLTYPVRYIWGKYRIPVRLEDYQEPIDEVLRTLALTGKGLEVNTSGLRLGFTLPSLPYVKRFHQLGGEIVTIGSDAHRREHVGFGIDAGMDLLKEAGFKYFAFYRERKPVMLRLV